MKLSWTFVAYFSDINIPPHTTAIPTWLSKTQTHYFNSSSCFYSPHPFSFWRLPEARSYRHGRGPCTPQTAAPPPSPASTVLANPPFPALCAGLPDPRPHRPPSSRSAGRNKVLNRAIWAQAGGSAPPPPPAKPGPPGPQGAAPPPAPPSRALPGAPLPPGGQRRRRGGRPAAGRARGGTRRTPAPLRPSGPGLGRERVAGPGKEAQEPRSPLRRAASPLPGAASARSGHPAHPRAALRTRVVCGFHAGYLCPPATDEATQRLWAFSNPWSKAEPVRCRSSLGMVSKTCSRALKLPVCPTEPLRAPTRFKVTTFPTLTAPSH